MDSTGPGNSVLILGIGNVLMGDEGVGVEIVRRLQELPFPPGVICCDGGTGSFALLSLMQTAKRIILVDATLDGRPPGTIRRLQPRFSKDYPRTLTAHDIGLKDLLDAFHLLGEPVEIVLFTVSIAALQEPATAISEEVSMSIPLVMESILKEVAYCWGESLGRRLQKVRREEVCTN